MELIVKNTFRDKTDHVTVYTPETILEVKDKERAADLVKRGLCAEYKGKKVASVTLGEEATMAKPQATVAEEGSATKENDKKSKTEAKQ